MAPSIIDIDQTVLRNHPVFRVCDPGELEKIETSKKVVEFQEDKPIFVRDDPAEAIFCLCRGTAKILKYNPWKKSEQLIYLAKEGEVLGLSSILSQPTYPYTAIPLDAVQGYFVPRADIVQLMEKYPRLSLRIMKHVCLEIETVERQISSLARKTVSQRVAEVLLTLYNRFGTDPHQHLQIKLSRSELAELANTTPLNLSRTLKQFQRQGILLVGRNQIQLLAPSRLMELSG